MHKFYHQMRHETRRSVDNSGDMCITPRDPPLRSVADSVRHRSGGPPAGEISFYTRNATRRGGVTRCRKQLPTENGPNVRGRWTRFKNDTARGITLQAGDTECQKEFYASTRIEPRQALPYLFTLKFREFPPCRYTDCLPGLLDER